MAARRAPLLTPSAVAQYLEENDALLEAILENQNAGRLDACIHYQLQLQQNLIHLAADADEQPGLQRLTLQREPAASSTAVVPLPQVGSQPPGSQPLGLHASLQMVATADGGSDASRAQDDIRTGLAPADRSESLAAHATALALRGAATDDPDGSDVSAGPPAQDVDSPAPAPD